MKDKRQKTKRKYMNEPNGNKPTAEQALTLLDNLLRRVTQPALTRDDQENIVGAVLLIKARFEADAESIQDLRDIVLKQKEEIASQAQLLDTTPAAELTTQ